jgi:PEGA domain
MRGGFRVGLFTIPIMSLLMAGSALARKPRPQPIPPPMPAMPVSDTGTLIIDSMLEGATVEVDGKEIGTTPLPPTQLRPGNHTIKVSKRGFLALLDVVTIGAGLDSRFSADLFAEKAILKVGSPVEGAEVFVDGKLLGEVPLDVDIDPGRRSIRVSSEAYKDFVTVVEAVAGEEVKVDAPLVAVPGKFPPGKGPKATPAKRWYKKWWVWAIAGGVVATAVIVPVAASSGGGSAIDDFGPDRTFDIPR